ncbi:MAG: c-type cytochrome [Neisseriaceae bacterium]|nr:c-type cytochrome [Neisseriaceae bacterium]MBP6861661.1 c-type cytochrome [Neisseriaceae bacterium]
MNKRLVTLTLAVATGLTLSAGAWANAAADNLSRGEYLARAGDCIACHTAKDGEPFAGGLPMGSPVGVIYSTNITPDPTHGIGQYTLADFDQAVRHGKAKEGHHLYPAMPFTAYAKVTDDDLKALYDYFMTEVKPVAQANKPTAIEAPMNQRWPLAIWGKVFHDSSVFQPDPEQSTEINRGAYLVEGLGHCGTCHTPRNVAMQEKGLTGKDTQYLAGAYLDGWWAPSLRGMDFDQADLVRLLQDGHGRKTSFSGPMGEVVSESLQYLSTDDVKSMVVYLNSLSSEPVKANKPAVLPEAVQRQGQGTYMMYCSSCHGASGKGFDYVVPELANNGRMNVTLTNAVQVILNGAKTPITSGQTAYHMPGYGHILNDEEVASVANYIGTSWGNAAPVIEASEVAKIRKGPEPISAMAVVGGIAAAGIVGLLLLVWVLRKLLGRKKRR